MDDLSTGLSALKLDNFPSARLKIDQFFVEWLQLEGTEFIEFLSKLSSQEREVGSGFDADAIDHIDQIEQAGSGLSNPPKSPTKRSPKKRTQAEMHNPRSPSSSMSLSSFSPSAILASSSSSSSSAASSSSSSSTSLYIDNTSESKAGAKDISSAKYNSTDSTDNKQVHASARRRANVDTIPTFYFPGQRSRRQGRIEEDQLTNKLPEIEAFFKPFNSGNGIPVDKFVYVTKRLCNIPSFFNIPLCIRILSGYGNDKDNSFNNSRNKDPRNSTQKIKLKSFLQFWQKEIEPYDNYERFFRIVKQPDVDYITSDDFMPFLQELLRFHPGLFFLEHHEEFQRKYALAVITRIFYKVNKSRTGKITLRELRNSNLVAEFMHVDEETDINRVVEYFSYEHFYVLYCKFFELDTDKDSKITREDLLRYSEHSLSEAVVDRIFQVGTRVFTDGLNSGFKNVGMTFPDFIFFMLAEEDKTLDCALQYWFTCCDLDGDGKLTPDEMRHFYRLQLHRVTSLGQESINFVDVLCQMIDMIDPEDPSAITLADLTRPDKVHISGTLFDVLFNLHKFMRFESRDPFYEKQKREDSFNNDWDRYVAQEYRRLAQEDEGEANSMDIDDRLASLNDFDDDEDMYYRK